MRKAILTGAMVGLAALGGCNRAGQVPDHTNAAQSVDATGAPNPDQDPYLAMNTLLVKNACSNCHASDYARVGPAMKDVAAIYASDAVGQAQLTEKIIKGTKGKWGEAIMPPQHQVTEEGATELAKAIMALNVTKP